MSIRDLRSSNSLCGRLRAETRPTLSATLLTAVGLTTLDSCYEGCRYHTELELK